MKKLMIALAVAAVAVTSQAASIKWAGGSNAAMYTIALANLDGNGTVAPATSGTFMKGNSTLMATLTILSADGKTTIGSATKAMSYTMTGGKPATMWTIEDAQASTTYKYILEITGTQKNMATYADANWDYANAQIAWTYEGVLTTAASGTTEFGQTLRPDAWTVSGAVAVPEPTSAMLLLLGVAGLALRRRRA